MTNSNGEVHFFGLKKRSLNVMNSKVKGGVLFPTKSV